MRWIPLEPDFAVTATLWRVLDEAEQARADRFAFTIDKHSYIVAHALLRVMLSKEAGIAPGDWKFRAGPGGKPQIDSSAGHPDLRFSLSHTRGMVSVAVGRFHDLGVDVESWREAVPVLEIARRFFAPAEAELIAGLPLSEQNQAFYRLWTLKEAFVKATGQGIAAPIDGFAFSLDPVEIRFLPPERGHPDEWQFAEVRPGPGHRLALAVRRAASDPARLDLGALDVQHLV